MYKREALLLENHILKEKLENSEKEWVEHIDIFVEKWYEENKDNIDIGVVNLGFFKVDILPDYIEKHLYKKVLKILYSYLTTTLAPSLKNPES